MLRGHDTPNRFSGDGDSSGRPGYLDEEAGAAAGGLEHLDLETRPELVRRPRRSWSRASRKNERILSRSPSLSSASSRVAPP